MKYKIVKQTYGSGKEEYIVKCRPEYEGLFLFVYFFSVAITNSFPKFEVIKDAKFDTFEEAFEYVEQNKNREKEEKSAKEITEKEKRHNQITKEETVYKT